MKLLIVILSFLIFTPSQAKEEIPTITARDAGLDEVSAAAISISLELHNGQYEVAIEQFHPRFYGLVRTAARMLAERSSYDIFGEGVDKEAFDKADDQELARMIIRPINKIHETVRGVVIVSDFIDDNIWYFALKMLPKKSQDNYPVPYVNLMPFKEFGGEWRYLDDKVFYQIVHRIIKHYGKKIRAPENRT